MREPKEFLRLDAGHLPVVFVKTGIAGVSSVNIGFAGENAAAAGLS